MFTAAITFLKFLGTLLVLMVALCGAFLFAGLLVREWRLERKAKPIARPELPPMEIEL